MGTFKFQILDICKILAKYYTNEKRKWQPEQQEQEQAR
jgi:hypothetical protein